MLQIWHPRSLDFKDNSPDQIDPVLFVTKMVTWKSNFFHLLSFLGAMQDIVLSPDPVPYFQTSTVIKGHVANDLSGDIECQGTPLLIKTQEGDLNSDFMSGYSAKHIAPDESMSTFFAINVF